MKALLDTGPWVALIDRSESMHTLCMQWFETFTGTLYTTEAVLTEALYLLNFSLDSPGLNEQRSVPHEFYLQEFFSPGSQPGLGVH
ncbi:MAG: PIN domain-containing protein [Desulfovermiculus sp.]